MEAGARRRRSTCQSSQQSPPRSTSVYVFSFRRLGRDPDHNGQGRCRPAFRRETEPVYASAGTQSQAACHGPAHIEAAPGIVLYTLIDPNLSEILEKPCEDLDLLRVAVLKPVIEAFERYLKMPSQAVVAAQHTLDADYFRRIDAMNFTLGHDDSQHTEDLVKADIVLIGASRTSKTPTSIYLANRGTRQRTCP